MREFDGTMESVEILPRTNEQGDEWDECHTLIDGERKYVIWCDNPLEAFNYAES